MERAINAFTCETGIFRASATRVGLIIRGFRADVRVHAAARRRHQVDRRGFRSVAFSASARSTTFLRRSGFFVPRFEPPVASAL